MPSIVRKVTRYVMLGLGVSTAVAAAAVLLVVLLAPRIGRTAWAKDRIGEYLSSSTGRAVAVRGDLELHVGRTIRIRVTEFTMAESNAGKEIPMLRVGSLKLSAPLSGLLRSPRFIGEVALGDTEVFVRRNSDGKSTWDFSSPGTNHPVPAEGPEAPPMLPGIGRIEVRNVRLSTDADVRAPAFELDRLDAERVYVDGAGTLTGALRIGAEPIEVKLTAASLDRLFLGGECALDLELRNRVHRLAGALRVARSGSGSFQLTASGSDTASLSWIAGTTVPEFGAYRVGVRGSAIVGPAIAVKLDDLAASIAGLELTGKGGVDVRSGGTLSGELALASGSHRLAGSARYGSRGELEATIEAAGGELRDLSPLFLTELPPWKDYLVSGTISSPSTGAGEFRFGAVKLKVGPNDLGGTAALKLAPLSVTAEVRSDSFDLGVFATPPAPPPDGAPSEPPAESAPPQTSVEPESYRLPYHLLEGVSGTVVYTAGSFRLPSGLEFRDVGMNLAVNEGRLMVPRVHGEVFGAEVSAEIEASSSSVKAKVGARHLAAEQLFPPVKAGAKPALTGKFDLDLDLHGTGDTVTKLVETSTGTVSLTSEQANLASFGLNTAASGLSRILGPIFGGSPRQDIECLVVEFDVANAIAHSKVQVMKLGDVYLFASGKIDLPKEKLTYNVNVNSVNPALASLVPPFRVFGSLGNPYVLPSVSGSVASLVDTTEGVLGSAVGGVASAASFLIGVESEKLEGTALCRSAYAAERRRLSSLIGDAIAR